MQGRCPAAAAVPHLGRLHDIVQRPQRLSLLGGWDSGLWAGQGHLASPRAAPQACSATAARAVLTVGEAEQQLRSPSNLLRALCAQKLLPAVQGEAGQWTRACARRGGQKAAAKGHQKGSEGRRPAQRSRVQPRAGCRGSEGARQRPGSLAPRQAPRLDLAGVSLSKVGQQLVCSAVERRAGLARRRVHP